MLKNVIIFMLMFCFLNCKQNNTHDVIQKVGIQLDEIDFLYEKIENDITIFADGINCESLFIKTDKAQIKGENCKYQITPDGNESLEISIFKLEPPSDTILLKSKKYLVESLPKPLLEIGNKRSGEINIRAFKAQQGISASNIAYYLVGCFNIRIEEFKVIVMRDDSVIGIVKNIGGRFNGKFEELKNDLRVNDVVYFIDATAKYPPDGELIYLNTMKITLIE